MKHCGTCDKTDGLCYTSNPPQVKCTVTGEFHHYDDECNILESTPQEGPKFTAVTTLRDIVADLEEQEKKKDQYLERVARSLHPETNADLIRGMTDEELADMLVRTDWCDHCVQLNEDGLCKIMEQEDRQLYDHCVAGALNWLRQPVKEDAT